MKALILAAMFFVALWAIADFNVSVKAAAPRGTASWYGSECAGRLMANGKPFDPAAMTCASWHFKLGTKVKVTNLATGRAVILEVTDRGPAKRLVARGRIIDLSRESFRKLEPDLGKGLIKISVEPAR